MLGEILASLKNTAKGSLKYDRSWVCEGRAKEILHNVSLLACVRYIPPEEKCLSAQEEKEEEDKTEVSDTQGQTTVVLEPVSNKEPDTLLDNCSKILEYEQIRKKYVQENVSSFVSEFDVFGEQRNRHIERQMALLQHSRQLEDQRRNDQVAQLQAQELLEVKDQQSKLKEHQRTHAKRLNEKMREMEEKQKQLEKLELRRKQLQEERRYQILAIQSQVSAMLPSFAEALTSCSRTDLLQQEPRVHFQVVLDAQNGLRGLLDASLGRELTLEDSQHAEVHFLSAKAGLSCLQSDIAQANARGRELEQKVEVVPNKGIKSSQPEHVMESDYIQPVITQQTEPSPTETTGDEESRKDLSILTGCADPKYFFIYEQLMKEMRDWEETFKPLETDPSLKKLQFEMKKAVNTPVNAISSQSGQQLRDKLNRLISLLSGGTVPSAGGRTGFTCRQHPLGLHFCVHLLAKKIVSQAESQVASHQEAAFPLAAVAVGLWVRFPKFGELLLAQLYARCPYLVPIYHQKTKEQTEKEFHDLLGYKYENDEMEPQDQYLKRMGGIVCFYAALLQTSPPPGYAKSHPHGIQHGWRFLTQLVNLRPRFDITATVLFNFLEVAGAALYRTYGKQMHKLIYFLHKEYIQQISKVTAGTSGGPVSRLETFLADTAKSGRIASPNGILTTGFWNT